MGRTLGEATHANSPDATEPYGSPYDVGVILLLFVLCSYFPLMDSVLTERPQVKHPLYILLKFFPIQ